MSQTEKEEEVIQTRAEIGKITALIAVLISVPIKLALRVRNVDLLTEGTEIDAEVTLKIQIDRDEIVTEAWTV